MTKLFSMKQLAQVLIDSLSIREESYDMKAAESAKGKWVDYSKFYTKTQNQAIRESVKKNGLPKEMERFIDLSLHWSNDIIEWCESIGINYPGKNKER